MRSSGVWWSFTTDCPQNTQTTQKQKRTELDSLSRSSEVFLSSPLLHFGYAAARIMEQFPLKNEAYKILGACFEVYKEKGKRAAKTWNGKRANSN